MNAALRSTILREPRPSDAGDVRVTMKPPGWSLVWIRNGREEEPFGPVFLHVAQAAEAAREVRRAHGLV
jgi:hypothetical protein